jgi:DNA-binding Lrp family transcriptional regulator
VKSNKYKSLRRTHVRVLEGLALYGPRNVSKLSAELNMPRGAVRYRINYLRSHFSLRFLGSMYHTYVGLRKVVVFAQSKPGYEELLYECLKFNDYWLYVSQGIATPKCLAIYGIPSGKEKELEEFLSKLEKLDQVSSVRFFWSTCFQNVNATSEWFDDTSEEWVFPWDLWLKEVQVKKGELPYTLKDPSGYPQMADWIDIMILKELEKDCAIKLKEIAKKLGISLQRVKYHFENHVIKEKMFEGPQILAEHYAGLSADTYYFRFVFKNHENFTKFACSLINKPFIRVMGKVYGKNQLFVQVYLPRQQLRNFIDALSKLIRGGFLDTYEYFIQDLTKTERETIPYQLFKDNHWVYEHKVYLEKLRSVRIDS